MLSKGHAKKVTIYVNEDTQYKLQSLYSAILQYLLHKGIAGATVSRAIAGFGPHQVIHTIKIEVLTEHLPLKIEFIDAAEKVDAVLPTLYDMVIDGVIEVQDTTVIKAVMKERKPEPKLPHEKKQSTARLMRIYMGEADRWNGEPLYDAIIKRLNMMDISGATVYRGILGYGAKGHTHKQSFLHISHDLPVMIAVVDTPEKIKEAMETIEGMMQDGLIVTSDVEVVRLIHSYPAEGASDGTGTSR
jgi:PII-like signaling protein